MYYTEEEYQIVYIGMSNQNCLREIFSRVPRTPKEMRERFRTEVEDNDARLISERTIAAYIYISRAKRKGISFPRKREKERASLSFLLEYRPDLRQLRSPGTIS